MAELSRVRVEWEEAVLRVEDPPLSRTKTLCRALLTEDEQIREVPAPILHTVQGLVAGELARRQEVEGG